MNKKVAIFGGSFDPFHSDHLGIINECINSLNFDSVWVVPTHLSPFKTKVHCTDEQRIAMIKIGINNLSNVEINTYEIDGGEIGTFKTVSYFKNEYPDIDFKFIMGSDQIQNFNKWSNSDKLREIIDFIVFERENTTDKKTIDINNWELHQFKNSNLSSTKIRSLVQIEDQIPELNKYAIENLLFLEDRLILSKKRFDHSINVGLMAKKLAEKFDVENINKAWISGTLHDVAKEMDYFEMEMLINQTNKKLLEEPKPVWHGFAGAKLLETKWMIKDKDILNAVFNHTVGSEHMTKLDKIVFCADKISIERNYDGVEEIRKLIFSNLDEGFKEILKRQYEFAIKKNGINNVGVMLKKTYKKYID
ncbi:nicotinate-nucleotide adenylyltransferase [Spiroplasma sp. TIUS-1]|uniref:nicotinate-nucleotide adenylyltransferase n=1 Tax=Spiroplasma sp. TIUS-1 TaxID=216963 RepID=UPI001398276B|nr:nicotinate-nucleotide adenylyltransferase [Spiroplasma sp. TIUS-1]QHX35962.1 nicotinate-nucleotide adenylyltransferase [Spiroplasma sp. TIUS-1]